MVNNPKQRTAEGGFTLVEVFCACAVLAIVATVAFTGDSAQMQHVGSSFRESVANHLAAGRLETLRRKPELLEKGESTFTGDLDKAAAGNLPAVAARQIVRCPAPGLYEVRVQLSWLPRGGASRRRVALTTLIMREEEEAEMEKGEDR